MSNETVTHEKQIHPFQRAGLGLAPFKFAGFRESVYQACSGAPVQPGSSCDYCGTGIRYVCDIVSADGKRFKVGCDCVQKINDERNEARSLDNSDIAKLARKVKEAKKEHERVKRIAKGTEDVAAVDALIDANREKLASMPHPRGWEGKSFLDHCEWLRRNAGMSGTAKLLKEIRAAIG